VSSLFQRFWFWCLGMRLTGNALLRWSPDCQPVLNDLSLAFRGTLVSTKSMSEPSNSQPQAQARWRRGYWSLIATQFQGAFNENGLKNLIIFLVLGMGLTDAQRDRMVLVVGALFSLPFILFSMAGGYFADRYSKRTIAIATKLLEMAVIVFVTFGLARHNLNIEMAAIFLAST